MRNVQPASPLPSAAAFLCGVLVLAAASVSAAEPPTSATLPCVPGESIALPAPTTEGGLPLLTALALRQSGREFAAEPLPLTVLSDLLWAACGVNRPDSGKRTAATARNWQSLDVYAVTAAGAFRYEPAAHALVAVAAGDLRALTGAQPFVATAPLNLVYVSDQDRMPGIDPAREGLLYAGAHAGIVAQNVYLFAAGADLATVLRASVEREALATALGLSPAQAVVMAQTVGYPAGALR